MTALINELFVMMDKNNDGFLDETEGLLAAKAMGEDDDQARKSWQVTGNNLINSVFC